MGSTEFIYDFDDQKVQTPFTFYEDVALDIPCDEPNEAGELQLMAVSQGYELKKLSRFEVEFYDKLLSYFYRRVGEFVTYQEIMDCCRQMGYLKLPHMYPYPAWPPLTKLMNRLWRAGLVKKYRRGLWQGQMRKEPHERHGVNHGVTYWLWEGRDQRAAIRVHRAVQEKT